MPSGVFLFRWVGELVDASLVAAAEEVAGEESGDAGLGHLDPDQPGAECNGIGIIVLAGEGGGERLGNLRAATGGVAVRGDRDPDARSADRDSTLGPSIRQRLRQKGAVARVIDALAGVGAEIDDLVAVGTEPVCKLILHLEAGMVGGKGYSHGG